MTSFEPSDPLDSAHYHLLTEQYLNPEINVTSIINIDKRCMIPIYFYFKHKKQITKTNVC